MNLGPSFMANGSSHLVSLNLSVSDVDKRGFRGSSQESPDP